MNEELLARLDLLAEKLETTGTHLYSVLVTQAYVEAVGAVIMIIITLISAYGMVILHRKLPEFIGNGS